MEDLAVQRPQLTPQGFGFFTVVADESLEGVIAARFSSLRDVIGRLLLSREGRRR